MTQSRSTRDASWRARLRCFLHAGRGLAALVATQWNARIHLLASLVVVIAGFSFGIARWEWSLLLLAMAGVWAAEALNTAIEVLTDLVSPEMHPLAGRAKDLGAAAVLAASIGAAGVGLLVFAPRLMP